MHLIKQWPCYNAHITLVSVKLVLRTWMVSNFMTVGLSAEGSAQDETPIRFKAVTRAPPYK